jgi:hypothetical protein
MRKGNSEPLSPKLAAELAALEALPDDTVDTSDIPEVLDWSGAERGRFYRPRKVQKTLRINPTSAILRSEEVPCAPISTRRRLTSRPPTRFPSVWHRQV